MIKWEYEIIDSKYFGGIHTKEFIKEINEWGIEGWECIQVIEGAVLLKRKIIEPL